MDDKEETLNNFLLMTDSTDYGAAMEYLENNNWDISEAVNQYINVHKFRDTNNPAENRPGYRPTPTPAVQTTNYNYEQMIDDSPNDFGYHQESYYSSNIRDDGAQNEPQQLINNQPGSMISSFQNMASSMMSSIGGVFNRFRGNQDPDSEMEDNTESVPSGRFFVEKWREKNGMGITLPDFVEGSFESIIKESSRLRRPIFFYLHDHKGDSCTIVDQTVIGEEIVKDLVNKFICVGMNVHSPEGKNLIETYNLPGAPYMAVMHFDEDHNMQNAGSRYGDEINVNALFEMCDTAYDMMAAMFDPMLGIPEFNVADSNLNIVETLDVKAEIEDSLKNQVNTGFVESRRREREIDPNTGFPVGMTEQQIQDKILKDQQREELEAAMAADKIKLQAAAQAEEERKQKNLEESKRVQAEQEKQRMKEFKASQVKSNLPDEPSEDNPDASTVQFRLPNSNNIQRRFLKTDKIQSMYDYIHSIGHDNG